MSADAVFTFGDLGVRVESSEPGHVAWLAEFFRPHFDVRARAPHACRVLLTEDRAAYGAALAAGAAGGTLDAFALDTSLVRLPLWRGADRRLFDAQREVFYDLAGDPLTVTIVSAPGNWKARTALMRVVRELATNHAQRAGGLLLHASAFARTGRGVVVTGAKEAGKTTLLVHALRAARVEYVANDRVLVSAGPPPRGLGVPTIVSLRPGTLELFPALAADLTASGYFQRLTLEEAAARPAPRAGQRSDKASVSPAQFCRLLGVPARAGCEIVAVLFPRVTHEPGGFALGRLPVDEVALRLESTLFGVGPGRWTSDVFTPAGAPPDPDRAALTARTRDLAERVHGFECRLGVSAYEPASAAEELVEALLG